MNYEQEYNKLFEYFSNIIRYTDRVKTSDRLIQKFENYDVINKDDHLALQLYKEVEALESLTSIIENLKIQLKELTNLNQEKLQKKIEDMINLCETRKTIYCSENEESSEKPEGYIGAKILESIFSEVYSDEEEITEDDEIPDW